MHLADGFWSSVTYVVSFFSFSPLEGNGVQLQVPIVPVPEAPFVSAKGPRFKPPGGRLTGPGSEFVCSYPKMVGFTNCSTSEDRSCWLKNEETGQRFDINTNYELPDDDHTPIGIHRTYYLNITETTVNADGITFPYAKLFNLSYPGPWIQGCWGDNITVIFQNKMKYNGTSIHWHGIRQWLTMHMDGVNGVTQCPIAPGDSFNYTFRAMQYGSSWYHSHFSVQYADGAVGPLTLHGPTYRPFDESKTPLLVTDWGHNSAFDGIWNGLNNETILLNGVGNVTQYNNSQPNVTAIPPQYQIHFDPQQKPRPKRYLLRIINTSFEATFVFSIDNHLLNVVEADFVPIQNYTTTSILVGIGQRYHVIVEANPIAADGDPPPDDGNFWIRTWKANCFFFDQSQASPGYEKTGVLRYSDSESFPKSTQWGNIPLACSDEPYQNLKPVLPWTVQRPPANDVIGGVGENLTVQFKNSPNIFPLAKFSMAGLDFDPMQINYSHPTFLDLNHSGPWPDRWIVYPENYTSTSWVYLLLKGLGGRTGAHPIHLHGHDFAILQQIEGANFPCGLNPKFNNPPRRDVVLLPTNGYVLIAFKTDNPGAWLMHCHIAYHASFGLALQIVERQQDAVAIWPDIKDSHALQVAQKGCDVWDEWYENCTNWFPGDGSACAGGENQFSPDSGI